MRQAMTYMNVCQLSFALWLTLTAIAHAEVIDTIPTAPSQLEGLLPDATVCGHTVTWKFHMDSGKFYALTLFFGQNGTVILRNADKASIASFEVFATEDDPSGGREARGTYT